MFKLNTYRVFCFLLLATVTGCSAAPSTPPHVISQQFSDTVRWNLVESTVRVSNDYYNNQTVGSIVGSDDHGFYVLTTNRILSEQTARLTVSTFTKGRHPEPAHTYSDAVPINTLQCHHGTLVVLFVRGGIPPHVLTFSRTDQSTGDTVYASALSDDVPHGHPGEVIAGNHPMLFVAIEPSNSVAYPGGAIMNQQGHCTGITYDSSLSQVGGVHYQHRVPKLKVVPGSVVGKFVHDNGYARKPFADEPTDVDSDDAGQDLPVLTGVIIVAAILFGLYVFANALRQ